MKIRYIITAVLIFILLTAAVACTPATGTDYPKRWKLPNSWVKS